ncbi:hypothetical protein ACN4EG_19145 [Alkalinema pantanalense CENA528]|uniref:hypothetical protein n=1 Tax=Alkalinema pantanalense TaxID=1620705 RepID=UPI003D6EF859
MILKETLLQELETADEELLEELLQLIRSRQIAKPKMTIVDTIDAYREEMIASGLTIDPDEVWGDVRDQIPIIESQPFLH